MTEIRVFDPAMCSSTGICGPSVDPQLARFAADLDWLKSQGISVERFNLAQQPAAFATDPAVVAALETRGEASLPLVKVNGEVVSSGGFPSRDQLASWAGVKAVARKAGGCCGSGEAVDAAAVDEVEGGCCGGAERAATGAEKSKRCCCG